MPMILGPNIWSKYFGKNVKNSKDQKRAHDDLIKINLNSPEAFEEVFWKLPLNQNIFQIILFLMQKFLKLI